MVDMFEVLGTPAACRQALARQFESHVVSTFSAIAAESPLVGFMRVRVRHVVGKSVEVDVAEVDPRTLDSKTDAGEAKPIL